MVRLFCQTHQNSIHKKKNLKFDDNIEKKSKPISNTKLISKVLKKIERKESDIRKMTALLQSTDSKNLVTKEYKELLENLKSAQSDLDSLESEWLELEEKSLDYE